MVAHNGFKYDFPLLLVEMERRPKTLTPTSLITHRLMLTDTLPYLRQVYTHATDNGVLHYYATDPSGKERQSPCSQGGAEVWAGVLVLPLLPKQDISRLIHMQ